MQLNCHISGAGLSVQGLPISAEYLVIKTLNPDAEYWGFTYGGAFGLADGVIRGWTVPAEFERLFLNLHGKRIRIAIYEPVILWRTVDCEIWVYDKGDGTPTQISRRGMPCEGPLLGTVDVTAALTRRSHRQPVSSANRCRIHHRHYGTHAG